MTGLLLNMPAFPALADSGVPYIAVSFSDQISDAELASARADGLDIAELRVDRYSSFEVNHVLAQVKRFKAFPTIGTIRCADEGGDWRGSDDDRLSLFRCIIPLVDAIDIELNSHGIVGEVVAAAHQAGRAVIVSNHNFSETPSLGELERMADDATALGADLVKLSAWAHSEADVRTLAAFAIDHRDIGLIVIAMGPLGPASRIFFPMLGSRITYAHAGAYPVSGQLDFHETFEMLRRFYPAFNEKKISELELLEDV